MILPNCVDLSAFTPGEKSAALLARYSLQNRTVLLTLGRLAEEERYKGFDEVLEVLPVLARDVPDVTYMIVGDGPDRARLEQRRRNDSTDRVIFAGRISEEEKADHYRLADIYVMPSSGEGFGIVHLEAMACGIPVIGSKIDGSRDALRNGRLGILVNPTDGAELCKAILRTLAEKSTGDRRHGVEYFSTERFCERVFQIIDAITSTPAHGVINNRQCPTVEKAEPPFSKLDLRALHSSGPACCPFSRFVQQSAACLPAIVVSSFRIVPDISY